MVWIYHIHYVSPASIDSTFIKVGYQLYQIKSSISDVSIYNTGPFKPISIVSFDRLLTIIMVMNLTFSAYL